jgi:hypothetical protein
MIRRTIFFGVILMGFLKVSGQEMLGAVLGNYSGVYGLQVNPSSMSQSKTWLDVNLLGGDIFFQNNYLYMDSKDYRFMNFFKGGYQYPEHTELYGTGDRIFYRYPNERDKTGYVSLRLDGPGAMLTWGRHAFALTTSVRSMLSMNHLPYELANFIYLGLNYRPQQNINYRDRRFFSGAELTWGEIGLSYSYVVYGRNLNKISAGISVRRLEGLAGGYVYSRDANYTVPNDSTLIVNNLDAQIGYSLPVDYDNNSLWNNRLIKGGGFAGDIGVTFTRLKRIYQRQYSNSFCGFHYEDYLYRIGLSLIDVGAIRFSTHAEQYTIDNRSSYWNNINRFDYNSLHQLMDTVSYMFYGNSTGAYTGNHITVWLPSALSAQFDYHFLNNWYLNGSVIYGFGLVRNSVIRPSQISVTPRYESRWFEADLPVSLYNWNLVRIGLSLRFYGFTIGTDKVGWLFHMSDFTGMDFYFSIRYFLDKGICRTGAQKDCTDQEYFHHSKR